LRETSSGYYTSFSPSSVLRNARPAFNTDKKVLEILKEISRLKIDETSV